MKGTVASIGNSSPATGFGWACSSDHFKDGFGLYDKCIVGGGDTLIYSAANNELKEWFDKRSTTLAHARSIVEWSNQWYSKVGGDLGFADNNIETFFHGSLKNRNYLNRHEILLLNSFNPSKDISISGETGLLEWDNSSKVVLQEDIRDYFASRQEDL